MSDAVRALAGSMVARKKSGRDPYILLIGAGASLSSECSSMISIVDDVLETYSKTEFNNWKKEIEDATLLDERYGKLLKKDIDGKKLILFFDIWSTRDHDTRYSILREHLWEGKIPSKGYNDLVDIIKQGYFNTIISTNLDHLIEKALEEKGLRRPDNFIVLVNGKDKPEEIIEQIESSRVSLKILKLHGTLESPRSYAFTEEEIFDFTKEIKPKLVQIINKSIIIIGHSMQDRDINVLFEGEGKEIHFVNPSLPDPGSMIYKTLVVRRKGNIISGDDGDFDTFFQKLKLYLEEEAEDLENINSTYSIERFLKSIGYEHELRVPQSRYKNLSTLYVKPTEYDSICSKLEKDHVVFIIGEPHLGKTYTAIHILWEYYQKGYETLHIRHDQLITLLYANNSNSEKLLHDLISEKKGESLIIHFDDPFGETIERSSYDFAKDLDGFLNLSRKYEHLRIIVTSRLSTFRESLAQHNYQNIEELERDLRVHTSYKEEVILDILHRYVHFYKPRWSSNQEVVSTLNEKIPQMLPAPHNIEFFVRTSENLNSLDEVMLHVEKSKEMIVALGEWMINLPSYEQIFLIWVEIISTSNVLFYNRQSSQINIVKAYRETLSYLYKKGYVEGILMKSYSRAKDKFDMIILESRDTNSDLSKFDFVHPSYHEAFWYTMKDGSQLLYWWQIIKENLKDILKDLKNNLDQIQLRMIENYGSVNRDLDKLLVISSGSEDINEKSIALEYLMERPELFPKSPAYYSCAKAVILSDNPTHRRIFVNSFDKCYFHLSDDVLDVSLLMIFDKDKDIQRKVLTIFTEPTVISYLDKREELKIWQVFKKYEMLRLIHKIFQISDSWTSKSGIFEGKYRRDSSLYREIRKIKQLDNFRQITPLEFEMLFQNNIVAGLQLLDWAFFKDISGLKDLNSEQEKNLEKIISSPYLVNRSLIETWEMRETFNQFSRAIEENKKTFYEKGIFKFIFKT